MNEKQQPTIETRHLKLRPFALDDAPDVRRLTGDKEIAYAMGACPATIKTV